MSASKIFPWRYGMFLALLAVMAPLALWLPWHEAVMAGFDIAALAFILSTGGLVDAAPAAMRRKAAANDANRELMLLMTGIVCLVILVAVGVAISQHGGPNAASIAMLLATLLIAWLFSNLVYAMHYAHAYYLQDTHGKDGGGLDFPETPEPRYWDFFYFAFTLGMTFQTSDVAMTNGAMRRIALFHCFAAFLFNLGILAFTINVLGGS
ncbi:DUF1345 domain-containing protein [Sphingobium sp. CCH11-B1]|jgi:uncharacterized membrane protein|uniref:DUF1345 domain-containing protein n=1 Tax=Sphingobium sp. CCH11-B1 TaxID=1768781 RepID=UPI00082F3EBF|nr:DUF1345 domain-containing protein [Sphingobium sp. CCH11-B1]MEA3388743.1 DUF1345 domain-containing protein [Pseudomonadota bacterium]